MLYNFCWIFVPCYTQSCVFWCCTLQKKKTKITFSAETYLVPKWIPPKCPCPVYYDPFRASLSRHDSRIKIRDFFDSIRMYIIRACYKRETQFSATCIIQLADFNGWISKSVGFYWLAAVLFSFKHIFIQII